MASNDAKEALLSGLLDPTKQKKNMLDPKVRRIRRIKSAPLAEFVPPDINGKDSSPPTKPVFGELHQSFIKVALFLAIYLGIGSMCFYFARNHIDGKKTNGLLDAVYFCIVTMTTVGYGDLVPHSTFSKLLACVFVFTGMALIGLILSKAADYLVEKQEVLLVKALHMQHRLGLSEILKEIETNRVRYKCYLATGILFVVMLVGTTFLHKVEHLDLIDAFYCVCATITTLGYGDVSFSTTGGRIFAVVWILIGTISLAQMFLCVAELFTESRQRALVNWVLTRKMTNTDLEAADFDNDGVVGAAEFVLYKLKEMGKITQEDIVLIMEEFEELDVDQSGSISLSDISIAQSTETKR